MVHKKYAYRNGKRYGPYLYENKRVGDKVVTSYLGKSCRRKKSYWVYPVAVLFLVAAGIFVYEKFELGIMFSPLSEPKLLLSKSSYVSGEEIGGKFNFYLVGGELIPLDSKVVGGLGDVEKSFVLSELVDEEIFEGDFYLEKIGSFGAGKGYGLVGKKETYPEVNFQIKLTGKEVSGGGEPVSVDEDVVEEEVVEEEVVEEEVVGEEVVGEEVVGEEVVGEEVVGEEVVGEESSEDSAGSSEESSGETESAGESEGGGGSVGDSGESEGSSDSGSSGEFGSGVGEPALSPAELVIDGIAISGEDFVYELEGKWDAEIVSGSVFVEGESVDDSNVDLSVEDGEVVVSTDYASLEEGFGEDYYNVDEELEIKVDLGLFEFAASDESEELEVRIVYDGVILFSSKERVLVGGEIGGEEEVVPEETVKFTGGEVVSEIELGVKPVWILEVEGPSPVEIELPKDGEVIDIEIISSGEEIEEVVPEEFVEGDEQEVGEVTPQDSVEEAGVLENEIMFSPSEDSNFKIVVIEDLKAGEIAKVSYTTPAPEIVFEEATERGKRIRISGSDNSVYENVRAFVSLPEVESVNALYWEEEDSYLEFEVFDKDEDGLLDYIEWIVPHLSNQTFEIIYITDAEHLDENRDFVEDVYEQVRERDDVWVEIPAEHYLRVVFEKNLTSEKDITLYARSNYSGAFVEVYEKDGDELIVSFDEIAEDKEYKVFLTNLSGEKDTFDLLVKNGAVEFDWVVDPEENPKEIGACGLPPIGYWEEGEYYVLTGDLTKYTSLPCFVITADNVVFNGDGHTISSNGDTSIYGIRIDAINVTIKNFTFDTIWVGLQNYGSDSTIEDCVFLNNDYSIYFSPQSPGYYVENNLVKDTVIETSENEDVHLSADCPNNTFLNVSYDVVKETIQPGGELIRKWYYRAYAEEDTLGNPLSGVVVRVYNASDDLQFELTTYETGYTETIEIIDYVNDGGSVTDYSPYTIYADYLGEPLTREHYVEDNIEDVFTFTYLDETAPNVEFTGLTPESGETHYGSINVGLLSSDPPLDEHYAFVDFDYDVGLWMGMDEVDGDYVIDNSSYGGNGYAAGDEIQVEGYFGKGFAFGEDGDYILVNKQQGISIDGDELTISAWVKPNWNSRDTVQNHLVVDKTPYPTAETYRLLFNKGVRQWRLVLRTSEGKSTCDTTTEAGFDAYTWHHIVAVYDGSEVRIWVDDVKEATCSGISGDILPNSDSLTIGRASRVNTAGFDGIIDELMIFDRALSEEEVHSLHNAELPNQYSHEFSPVSFETHTFTGYAVDRAGNKGDTGERQVFTEGVPPVLTVISPLDGSNYNVEEEISYEISLDEAGSWCRLNLDGAYEPMIHVTSTYFSGGPRTSGGFAEELHNVQFTCADLSGNEGTSDLHNFLFDTTEPVIEFGASTIEDGLIGQDPPEATVEVTSSDNLGEHYSFVDFDKDVLLWMKMDEVDGDGDPLDSSSYGNDGLKQDAAEQTYAGYFGRGFALDGDGDYINVTSSASLDSMEYHATVSFWAKSAIDLEDEGFPSAMGFFSLYSGDDDRMLLRIAKVGATGRISIYDNIDGADSWTTILSSWSGVTSWHNFVFVFNETDLKTFIDGDLKNKTTLTSQLSELDDGMEVWIGRSYLQQTNMWNGTIDDFMVFKRGLSDEEVTALYDASANQYAHQFTGLENKTHTFTGYAVDKGGNSAQTEGRSFHVGPIIDVSSSYCGSIPLSTPGGYYRLIESFLSSLNSGICLEIIAKDVVLDGNGYTITLNPDPTNSVKGVYSYGTSGLVIKNLKVEGFSNGINLAGVTDSLVKNNSLLRGEGEGIVYGLKIGSSSENIRVINNTISSNDRGIQLQNANYNLIQDNVISSSLYDGVYITNSLGNKLIGNVINYTTNGAGITIGADAWVSSNNLLERNVLHNNAYGVRFAGGGTVRDNLLLNNQIFNNTQRSVYDIAGAVGVNYLVYNNSFGEIKWTNTNFLNTMIVKGNLTFPGTVKIEQNFAELDDVLFAPDEKINSSAEITLYDYPGQGIEEPVILRNNMFLCNETTTPRCYNFTSLDAGIIIFNVSSWSNYRIGKLGFIFDCDTLGVANKDYVLGRDISITGDCFIITADNITLDGNGYSITGDGDSSDYGVHADGVRNATIKNLDIINFGHGIYLDGTNYSTVRNVNNTDTTTAVDFGLRLEDSNNNLVEDSVFDSSVSTKTSYGVSLGNSFNNEFRNNNITSIDEGLILASSSNNVFKGGAIEGDSYYYGVDIRSGSHNNTFENVGISLEDTSANEISFTVSSSNGTRLINTFFGRYKFNDGIKGTLIFENTQFGKIQFLESVNGSGANLSHDVRIGNNSVTVESGNNPGLNESANITLYGIGDRGFDNIAVLRDGRRCPDGICYNFTSLTDEDVSFNVNYWTNYSIGEGGLYNCRELNEPNKVYVLRNDIPNIVGTCFNITADNVTLDGNGYFIDGDGADYGVYSRGTRNITIRNLTVEDFEYGIYFINGFNNTLIDNTIYDNGNFGIYISSGSDNRLIKNSIRNNQGGIRLQSTTSNNLMENLIERSVVYGVYLNGASNNLLNNNTINGSYNGPGIFFVSSPENNVLLNNQIFDNEDGSITDNAPLYVNYLIYNNSFGEIKWIDEDFLKNMDVAGNLTFPGTIRIEENLAELNDALFVLDGKINSSANITLDIQIPLSLVHPIILHNNEFVCSETTTPRCSNFTSLDADIIIFNVSSWSNYSIGQGNNLPEVSVVTLSSTDGSNRTKQDLNCFAQVFDEDDDWMNYTLIFYETASLPVIISHPICDVYSGQVASESLDDTETKKGDIWNCSIEVCDERGECAVGYSEDLLILNTLPVVSLVLPEDNYQTIDRTPTFNWTVEDDDGDLIDEVHFNITCFDELGGSCSDDDVDETWPGAPLEYTLTDPLKYFIDDGYYYNWTVRAKDDEEYGLWAVPRRINITSFVDITLLNAGIDFGSMGVGDSDDTDDDIPLPFLLENSGNVFVNVTVNASDLWASEWNPTDKYQFKIDESSEAGAFDQGESIMIFIPVPEADPELPWDVAIANFNYDVDHNTCEIDINITVPDTEPPTEPDENRSSSITFIASRAE
ncbi:MAG: right-handed parallel beta-helix repeat-containing protein [Nanoarchaeota archaeon]|nr:right-handed parallel beta-helix repeat-containing protein [Nanoarchaeota archaeon]